MRECSTPGCNGRVGDWVTGSICTTCLLDGKTDRKPNAKVKDEERPINSFGDYEAKSNDN